MTAIDLGPKLDHVDVYPFFWGDGSVAGYAVSCGPCHTTVAAYLEAHIKPDPGCVAREVERHRACGASQAEVT